MQYSNFIMKNNVFGELDTPISSLATTIQLKAGQGQRFGSSFPMIATIESFEDGKVVKREIVKVTAVSGDNLTVERGFAPCPASDDANSQGTTSFSFQTDDRISLFIPKEIFDKISNSLNDIYDNGTNNMRTEVVSGLQVEVNPGSVLVGSAYYDFAGGTITLTDNATNYLEIDEDGNLANNTTGRNEENTKLAMITTSGGSVTNIKDRRLGTVGGKIGGVNIHDLTEKASLSPDDELIIADKENIRQNKKIKVSNIGFDKNIKLVELGENVTVGDYQGSGYIATDGKFYLTDSEDPEKGFDGIALESGNIGDTIKIQFGGFYKLSSGLYNGEKLYVNNGYDSGGIVDFPNTPSQTLGGGNEYRYSFGNLYFKSFSAIFRHTYGRYINIYLYLGNTLIQTWNNVNSGDTINYSNGTRQQGELIIVAQSSYGGASAYFSDVKIEIQTKTKKGYYNNEPGFICIGEEKNGDIKLGQGIGYYQISNGKKEVLKYQQSGNGEIYSNNIQLGVSGDMIFKYSSNPGSGKYFGYLQIYKNGTRIDCGEIFGGSYLQTDNVYTELHINKDDIYRIRLKAENVQGNSYWAQIETYIFNS